jgi:hypothetical protein
MAIFLARRTALAAAVLALAASPATAWAQAPQRAHPLAALAFMAGCWRGDAGTDKTIEEHWTAADSDVMLATTRYLDDNTGTSRGWEFSRIVADSAGITLFPTPENQPQGRFRMARTTAGEARFEDPTHDFPRRIIYRRVDARHMVIRIDAGENDREAREWRMESVACPTPAP